MSDPLYSIGQAVMIRSKSRPEVNCDFSIVTFRKHGSSRNTMTGKVTTAWLYKTHNTTDQPEKTFWYESALRPIPPEEHNGIDAMEYIKDLTGVTVC